jgi:hypothetical protein
MVRINLVAITLLCVVAASSHASDSSTCGPCLRAIQTSTLDASLAELTAERIEHDVIGSVVMITAVAGDATPIEWTFDADELRQVEILEGEVTPAGAMITVLVMTRNNPEPDEESVSVSGKLRVSYQRKSGNWVLTAIENLTFRYTTSISI